MRWNRKTAGLACAFALVALLTGCGGISGSHSVSPATFLLPGILGQAEPVQPADAPIGQASVQLIAQSK